MGWFGRQIGHVGKAVGTDVTKPAPGGKRPAASSKPAAAGAKSTGGHAKSAGPAKKPAAAARPTPSANPAARPLVIYREDKVEEAELPDRPGVILRRTIIDEVVVHQPTPSPDGRKD